MKKYPNTAAKACMTAVMFILILLTLICGIISMVAVTENFYTNYRTEIQAQVDENITANKIYSVLSDYCDVIYYQKSEYYCSADYKGRTNFRYIITDNATGKMYGNYDADTEYSVSYTITDCQPHYWNWDDTDTTYTVTGYKLAEPADTSILESYNLAEFAVNITYSLRYAAPILTLLFCICCAVLFARLMRAAGHRTGSVEVSASWLDLVPFDILAAALSVIWVIMFCSVTELHYPHMSTILNIVLICGAIIFSAVLLYILFHSFAVRLKLRESHGRFWENTLTFIALRFVWKIIRFIGIKLWRGMCRVFDAIRSLFMMIPLVWRTSLVMFGIIFFSVITYGVHDTRFGRIFICGWIVLILAVAALVIYSAWATRLIETGLRIMSEGNIRHTVDTSKLFFIFKNQAQHLNSLGDGLESALQAQIKSERFKTELITNVSHDIKTPLTSIINYSDLILHENANGKIGEYTEVIYRQSQRLKKLTEDLLEASKASSGSITVNFERIELNQMLSQAVGEYAERLSSASLTPIYKFTDENICISADGKLLWRVFDNLLSNIVKYSLEGTRIYVDLSRHESDALISFKNISRDTLNVDADELLERFVRGDASRHSEGSGLGLNIAISLCELMHGKMSLSCDGDLFRVNLAFPIIQ